MTQTNAEGALAMIGTPREGEPPVNTAPDTVAGYLVYRSLDQRPRRTLLSEARPPNNCFDVLVDVQPRSLGILSRRGQQWVVVAPMDGTHEWVVTRIRVVSRSLPGPYSTGPVC
jgi:hypothetical protein